MSGPGCAAVCWWAAVAVAALPDELAAARDAERHHRYEEAERVCGGVVAAAPASPEAATCRAQLARWALRRDPDGSYGSLRTLEAVRRGEQPDDALAGWGDAVPRVLRAEAAGLRARRRLAAGDLDGAEALLAPWVGQEVGDSPAAAVLASLSAEVAAGRGEPAPPGTRAAQRATARWVGRVDVAAALVAAVALAASGPAAWRGLAWSTRPWGAALLGGAGLGAWAVAEGFEDGGGRAIGPMTAGLVAVHLWMVHALRGAGSPAHRVGVRLAAAAASAAVAWLAASRGGGLQALGLQ